MATTILDTVRAFDLQLFPVHRVILKTFYGIPLDTQEKHKFFWDWEHKDVRCLTEAEFLDALHAEGRASVCSRDVPGRKFQKLVLCAGRRGGKTMLASVMAGHEVMRLLSMDNPQKYYGLPGGTTINVMTVSTDKDQAGQLYQGASGFLRQWPQLQNHLANCTMSYSRFQTFQDIRQSGMWRENPTEARASIKMTLRSCIAKGLRGALNSLVILDELAHFAENGQSSADAVYQALAPSLSAMTPKNAEGQVTGPSEGRLVAISSPLGKWGVFWRLWSLGMKGGRAAEGILSFQIPTWMMNPTIPVSEFQHEERDSIMFQTEFGAEFMDEPETRVLEPADNEVVFKMPGPNGILVRKIEGNWCVTTGNIPD